LLGSKKLGRIICFPGANFYSKFAVAFAVVIVARRHRNYNDNILSHYSLLKYYNNIILLSSTYRDVDSWSGWSTIYVTVVPSTTVDDIRVTSRRLPEARLYSIAKTCCCVHCIHSGIPEVARTILHTAEKRPALRKRNVPSGIYTTVISLF